MGYQSDVDMVFYTSDPEKSAFVRLWVEENIKKEDPDEVEEHPYKDGVCVRVRFLNIKWYPDYEDVKAVMAAFHSFFEMGEGETDPKYYCEFLRVGEEYEDVEQKQSAWADCILGLSRESYLDI